ncbi:predicted protein [Plenodomus lingam JN3]|uniref:Predicted protein n=1 Tax=Leptosphaeria maculans (strain JN3 / isolate v23.1.3 / race Av1-4-5-6-7-8) TaxID=985895 RepID=E5R4M3_LEPMJ|nr:predicted protein [Plenodomus lingam JN3]CBX92146.1 predicted protein [Plenodomus lingam JN3]
MNVLYQSACSPSAVLRRCGISDLADVPVQSQGPTCRLVVEEHLSLLKIIWAVFAGHVMRLESKQDEDDERLRGKVIPRNEGRGMRRKVTPRSGEAGESQRYGKGSTLRRRDRLPEVRNCSASNASREEAQQFATARRRVAFCAYPPLTRVALTSGVLLG